MFITKEELDSRLKSNSNLSNILNPDSTSKDQVNKDIDTIIEGVVINGHGGKTRHIGNGGKVKGDENVPQIFREVIAAQAQFTDQKDLQKSWGLSQGEISHLKNGKVGGEGVRETIDKVRGVVRDRLTDKICSKLNSVLDSMTEDKIADEQSLKTLAMIARNLSGTMQSLEPKKEDKNLSVAVQTIIYAPEQRRTEQYEVLEVAR